MGTFLSAHAAMSSVGLAEHPDVFAAGLVVLLAGTMSSSPNHGLFRMVLTPLRLCHFPERRMGNTKGIWENLWILLTLLLSLFLHHPW